MPRETVLIAVAATLAAAAYILANDDAAEADTDTGASPTGATVTGNGYAINNPGNLRYIASNPWRGQTGNHGGYGVYDSIQDGFRAMGLQLAAYYNRGLTTITMIVSTWAPATENNVSAYVNDVSDRMGVDPNEPLAWPQDQADLCYAIAYHENGNCPYSTDQIAQWIAS